MTTRERTDAGSISTCLIHTGAIGDFILALRIVASLRAQWPTAEIHVLGHETIASLAVGRGPVDVVTSIERVRLHTMFSEDGPVDSSCRNYFQPFRVIVNMATAGDRTFDRRLREISRARIVTIDPHPRGRDRHVTEGWLDDLRAAGVTPSPEPPTLAFTNDERRQGRRRLQATTGSDDGPFVVLHPGSGGRKKCWPVDEFVGLAEALAPSGVRPVFMLGPVELDLHGEATSDRLMPTAPVLVEPDLVAAATVAAAADVYVGNDAGMTHVAAAAGTPTVAVFGATDPTIWQPLGDRVIVVSGDSPGTFDGVTGQRVHVAVRESLEKRGHSTFSRGGSID